MELPPLPDFRDPKFKFNDVDPEMDRLISQRAAQVVQAAPQMKQIEAIGEWVSRVKVRAIRWNTHSN